LVGHFLKDKVSPRNGKPFQLTRQTMEVLCAHDWPGNVRELENAIERACALCDENIIQVKDLPPSIQKYAAHLSVDTVIETRTGAPPSSMVVLSEALYPLTVSSRRPAARAACPTPPIPRKSALSKLSFRDQEVTHLNRALAFCGGDKEKAAEMLGISLATLYRKLAEVEETV
jgi:DNA-binding NtrC family response regulator